MLKKNKPASESAALTGKLFLKRYSKKQSFLLYAAVLSGTASTLLLLIQWVTFSYLAHSLFIEKAQLNDLYGSLIVLFTSLIGQPLFIRLQVNLSQKASVRIRNDIRLSILAKWRMSSPLVLKKHSAGASAAQWIEEVESMDSYFSRYWPQQNLAIISPILILSVIAWLDWLSALLLLISAPLIPLFMILVGMGAEKVNQKYSLIRQRLAGHFLDRVANLDYIKLLRSESAIYDEVKVNSEGYRTVVMKTLKLAFLSSTVLEFFTSVAIASLAIYIGFSLYGSIDWGPASSLTLFSGLAILILAPEFFQPLRNLAAFYHDRATALGSANNLVLLLDSDACDEKSTTSKKYYNLSVPDSGSEQHIAVRLQNLVIGYNQKLPLPHTINIDIQQAQMLSITGPSGAGKSTLLNTLAGYTAPIAGTMSIYPQAAPIAYLPQRGWIKNDTVFNNLKVLAPNATKEQMFDALRIVGLDKELLQKHTGLNTLIGEHGQGLSGGQIQRISIARVLLNPAPLILLDEPTSKLDRLSKKYIISALKILKKERILIVASHDPLLLNIADAHLDLSITSTEDDNEVLV
ncbi:MULTISPECIES: thiol reductant ABC exporter subunit CydD [Pseudoalteromonas]|jgi:ATP-binding cassette subfamily C protein CydD|uniref:Thiol reductant ABC exporter subunit CydD n=1 Tax=Pseudoalteromonas tetraodonis TaxID=43659 RepID=A0ABD4ETE5_9GAMM|nr:MULTISPECIES: thiol reductant ABC exporter subunit CydD [Pseudoalteromonas]MAY59963.1 thiol reductant ABC exporter subunit CydD [Pseudoalteromonas sp.]KYL36543.1 thiol reductant ABC exporter subunit CydD [Pseudoalteromonas spiralis]MDN3395678.1 thiol reductant ABC exporter subunit CydD [Pseudoalteromonas sp. APC 3215]MDN3399942.1 thiol reductant ABC exporter subunit CydD [Pseudoalteromonas sp. APC 3213]MDN3406538.1 thiol reductant ABC exporter subunit CydD [Pseudoalteromonas sp. APC 3218]|tara:strand:- start:1800 stop:3527 length:1728 start_codon:yes stop_codon:yes gene_type:complete